MVINTLCHDPQVLKLQEHRTVHAIVTMEAQGCHKEKTRAASAADMRGRVEAPEGTEHEDRLTKLTKVFRPQPIGAAFAMAA